ncbi:MAG: helix-turn-helix domain-containing protein [Thaumarchaeota archaeon]|nr:helix-turn-helix domain-containing protein [Nitrososphaerota archaeon]
MLKQVSISVKAGNVFEELAKKYGCVITIVDCKHANSREMSLLVEIDGNPTNLISDFRSRYDVKRVYFAKSTGSKTLIMLILESPLLCDVARNSNAFCTSCPYNSQVNEGVLQWNMFVKDETDMAKALDILQFRGIQADVRRIENAFSEELLTKRQEEVILAAVRLGYFDFPRKKSLTQLATELSIKSSSLSEILRRAESKIAKAYTRRLGRS